MTQPEALRLACALAVYLPKPQDMIDAAAELRRLHAELVESERWRDRDEFRAANAERERDIAEAQRDALLEALQHIERSTYDTMTATLARAAIAKAEGEKT